MMEIRNAIIESAQLHRKEHGFITVWLMLDYGDGSHQGFGGFNLYVGKRDRDITGKFIWRCMDIVGVDDWKDIVGKTIRVRLGDGFNPIIKAIGHIVKDDWFCPNTDLP